MSIKLVRSIPCLLAALLVPAMAGAEAEAFLLANNPDPILGGLQECTGFEEYQQPLDANNFGTARTSDAESAFLVAEDFVDGAGTITPHSGAADSMRWWGINFDFIATFCTDDDDAGTPFDITFWDDVPSVGNVVASATGVSPTIIDTGIPFAATTIREYSASFPSIDVTGATWVSIQRQTGVVGCQWLWVDETLIGSYDDMADQTGSVPSDHAFCMGASSAPVIEVPTVNEVGLVALLLSLLAAGMVLLRRRENAST